MLEVRLRYEQLTISSHHFYSYHYDDEGAVFRFSIWLFVFH